MHPFALSRPTDISAAIAAHARDAHLAFIAGGTDLIGLMKDGVTLPERLLDINRLPRRVSSSLRHPAWEFSDYSPLSLARSWPVC